MTEYYYQYMKEQKKPLVLKDLPLHLKKKYQHSLLFANQNHQTQQKFEFNLTKIKERKAEKEKTIEEKLQQFKINITEEKYLLKVFQNLSCKNSMRYFSDQDIRQVFKKMNIKMSRKQIERMVWQFDEDLNKKITEKQFINMYKKCTIDKNSSQSKNLFHLTQFLMYCKPNCYKITVEDTLELLFVRAKVELEKYAFKYQQKDVIKKLQEEIDVIFQGKQRTVQGLQTQINFTQYLQRINKRAIQKRKFEIESAKSVLKYKNGNK